MDSEKLELATVKNPNLHSMILHPAQRYMRFAINFIGLGFIAWFYFGSRVLAALPELSYGFLGVALITSLLLLFSAVKTLKNMFVPCRCGTQMPAVMLKSRHLRIFLLFSVVLNIVSLIIVFGALFCLPDLAYCAVYLFPSAFILGMIYLVFSLVLHIVRYEEKIAILAQDSIKGLAGKSDEELLELAGLANKLCLTEKAHAILQLVDKRGGE